MSEAPPPATSANEPTAAVEVNDAEATFDVDPWQKKEPPELLAPNPFAFQLPPSKVALVARAELSDAVRRLKTVDWVRLSASEAERFVGKKIVIGTSEVPILLRGTAYLPTPDPSLPNDKLRVAWKGGAVIVTQLCTRLAPRPPMAHSPVIAVLPAEPTVVYTSAATSLH